MAQKIIHSFNPNISKDRLDNGAVTVNFCSWERLKPALAWAAGVKEEDVIGVRASDQGVEIILK